MLRVALRAARERSGLTLEQVVTALEWSQSKMSRIEAGKIGFATTDLRALLDLYAVTDESTVQRLQSAARASRGTPWWHDLRDLLHPQQARRLEYETTATSVQEYAQILVPMPVQTPEYARAVAAAETRGTAGEPQVRRRVELAQRWARWRL